MTQPIDREREARASYSNVSDEEFWAWLQHQLPDAEFEACRAQPRLFVQQLHQVAWSEYVEAMVESEMNNWSLLQDYYASIAPSASVDSGWEM